METYDTVSADSLAVGDQVVIKGENCDVMAFSDEGEQVSLKVYSHDTGEVVTVSVNYDAPIDLWYY